MLTIQEIRSSTPKELIQELQSAQKALEQARIQIQTKHQKDTSALKKQRHYVARLKTVIKEAELEKLVETSVKIA